MIYLPTFGWFYCKCRYIINHALSVWGPGGCCSPFSEVWGHVAHNSKLLLRGCLPKRIITYFWGLKTVVGFLGSPNRGKTSRSIGIPKQMMFSGGDFRIPKVFPTISLFLMWITLRFSSQRRGLKCNFWKNPPLNDSFFVGGFKYFLFSSLFGEMIQFD